MSHLDNCEAYGHGDPGFDEDAEQCSLCEQEIYPEDPCHTVNGEIVCGDCILSCTNCGEPLDDEHDCELEAA